MVEYEDAEISSSQQIDFGFAYFCQFMFWKMLAGRILLHLKCNFADHW
jgi:hypothetical protein